MGRPKLTNTKTIQLRLPEKLLEELKQIADLEGISRTQIIHTFVKKGLADLLKGHNLFFWKIICILNINYLYCIWIFNNTGKNMKTNKFGETVKSTTIELPENLFDELDEQSKKSKTSKKQIIEKALTLLFGKKKWKLMHY